LKRIAAAFAHNQKWSREYLQRQMEGSMRFSPFTTTAVCSLLIALGIGFARPAWAAEIRVLNANALTLALRALAAEHTKQTGNQVTFISGSPGQIQQKVDAGEKFDLLIMPTPALAALDTDGKLAAGTRRALVRVGIGIAIREDAPKPDITTPDALRKTLLAQQRVTYSNSSTGGLSGVNAQRVLKNLGIADEIKSKLLPHADGQGLIAKGEADLGLYNVSEIPRTKGVVLLGPVPAAVQAYITYDAGVPASNASPSAAMEFLKFIASPAAGPSWLAAGLELAGP
jgi:molybdate transport system substrate-binding protein